MNTLEIIYQDQWMVAINKPHGLLVHKSNIAKYETEFAVDILQDQIKQSVYPIHRLDRKTSGILLFALDKTTAKELQQSWINRQVSKSYVAIVRGFFPKKITVDYALKNDRHKVQNAITHFKLIGKSEIPLPFGKHQSSRYSLIMALPETGRMHQIRKHCAHINHPIIGDRPHGCNKQNKLFKEKWAMDKMMLHASELKFPHPKSTIPLVIESPRSDQFIKTMRFLNLIK